MRTVCHNLYKINKWYAWQVATSCRSREPKCTIETHQFFSTFLCLVIWTEQNKLVSYSHRRHGLCLHIHWHKLIIMQHIKDTQFIHYLSGPTLFYFTVTDEHNTISMKHNWNSYNTLTDLWCAEHTSCQQYNVWYCWQTNTNCIWKVSAEVQ